jgi:hypothetical protein
MMKLRADYSQVLWATIQLGTFYLLVQINAQSYNFACSFESVWNLVSDNKVWNTEGVWKWC